MRNGRIIGLALAAVAVVAMAVSSGAAVTPAQQVNSPIVSNGDVVAGPIHVSPDSAHAVYAADQDTDGVLELYSWATGGLNQPVKLSMAAPAGWHIQKVAITPDSSRVLYVADHQTLGRFELFSRATNGSDAGPVVLSGALAVAGDVLEFAISPDGQWVVYVADQGRNVPTQLLARRIDRSQPDVLLAASFDAENELTESFAISPDSARVVYRSDQNADNSFELFSVPIDGTSAAVKLNGTLVTGGTVDVPVRISPDSNWVIYRADQDTDGVFELYSRRIDGSGSSTRLNAPLPAGSHVWRSFEISRDSSRAVYLADQDQLGRTELYSRPIDGSRASTKLNGPIVNGGRVHTFQLSPVSNTVLYRAAQDIRGIWELYTQAVDGSGPNLKINTPLTAGQEVWENFMISPDGRWVVWPQGTTSANSLLDLFAAPLDASAAPVQLDGPTIAGGGVIEEMIAISPDSRRVVYGADQDTVGVIELYSRSIDGGGTATRMSGALTSGGDVTDFTVLPDSSGVVYRADQGTDGQFELYMARWAFPDAVDDIATVDIDAAVEVGVLGNDTVAAGTLDPSSVEVTVPPQSGTAQATAGGAVQYSPTAGFEGYDSFTYTVCVVDDPSLCDTAVVYVGIGNVPPPTTTTTTTTTTTIPPTTTTTPPTTTTAPPTTTTAPPTTTTTPPTTTPPTKPPPPPSSSTKAGYWVLESDGDLRAFGTAPPLPSVKPNLARGARAVALARHPNGRGAWVLTSDGDLIARGSATDFGRVDLRSLTKPGEVVATLSATPDGTGLWVFSSAGRIISFGSARPASQMAGGTTLIGLNLDGPIVDAAATPTGRGVYMVAADGGVFVIGDAVFAGSVRGVLSDIYGPPGLPHAPVVGIVPDPDGRGYWIVAADGGVFTFNAPFRGSLPAIIPMHRLHAPVNGMVPYGNGYILVARDGGVFVFSNLPFAGSASGRVDSPVVDVAALG